MVILVPSFESNSVVKKGAYTWEERPKLLGLVFLHRGRQTNVVIKRKPNGWMFQVPVPGHTSQDLKLLLENDDLVVISLLPKAKREVYRVQEQIRIPWPQGCNLIRHVEARVTKGLLTIHVQDMTEIELSPMRRRCWL